MLVCQIYGGDDITYPKLLLGKIPIESHNLLPFSH